MNEIKTSADLKAAIAELEKKKEIQRLTIKGQFQQTKEALAPKNILRNTFSHAAETPEIKKILVSTIVGIGIGYFSKKITTALQEDKLDHMVNNFLDESMRRISERKPNSLISQAISITRKVTRDEPGL